MKTMKTMKTVKVEFDEKYHSILAEMADNEFRTIKATVEMIVVQYIDSKLAKNTTTNISYL